MNVTFTEDGWDDYTYWQGVDRAILKRINRLLADAQREPTQGMGKPEMLKWEFSGVWSRRITDEHRLVYLVKGNDLVILSARYHYER